MPPWSIDGRSRVMVRDTRRELTPTASRWALVAIVAVLMALVGTFVYSPYYVVKPGPAPDVTMLVSQQQLNGTGNPKLSKDGPLLAVTVERDRVVWGRWAWCQTRIPVCRDMSKSDGSYASGGDYNMHRSQEQAAASARQVLGGGVNYPNAILHAEFDHVKGASAGLVLALVFVDTLSSGMLAPNVTVAATGAVDSLGNVYQVEDVPYKIQAASTAGADVFFVPVDNAPAATARNTAGLTIVAVATVTEALRWLCENGATSSACSGLAQTAADRY